MESEKRRTSRPGKTLPVNLLLIGAAVACFWQVHGAGFINLDDDEYVTSNPWVKSGLTIQGAVWAFSSGHAANWHPLTWLSHMLDCEMYGLNPAGHHVTSLLFHLATTVLLFLVFKRMTGRLWQSGFIAALFAIHPLHVESVAWVAERKDVLSTLFWMLTLWKYADYSEGARVRGQNDHWGRLIGVAPETIKSYSLAVLFFALGLMSKPMLVTLPFVLLLLDYWPLGRFQHEGGRTHALGLIREKLPLFLLSAASSVVTFFVQRSGGAMGSFEALPFGVRVTHAVLAYVTYIGKMLWPADLAVYYPYTAVSPLWTVVGSLVLLAGITVGVIRLARSHAYLLVGWFWYLGTLVPVIGLVQVGGQSMADRYTYVPLVGLFIMIALGATDVLSRYRCGKVALAVSATAALAGLLVVGRMQVSYWHDSIRLFEHTLALTSNNYMIHNNLGTALERQGRIDEAMDHYRETLRIRPDAARTYFNMGNALARQGRIGEAMLHYQNALRIRQDYPEVHNNLGNLLERQGRIHEAMAHYIEALRLRPDYAEAENNLGVALGKQGKVREAMVHFKSAMALDSHYEKAYHNLGVALAQEGKTREAMACYNQALRIKPDFAEARFSLALANAASGDRTAALEQLTILRTINRSLAEGLSQELSR